MKKNIFTPFFYIFFFLCVLLTSPVLPARAQVNIGDLTHANHTQFNWFTRGFGVVSYNDIVEPGRIVQRITAIFFGLLGIIAVVMVMYAGFLWLTAGGEEEKTKTATTLLFQSFIGLAIILASWTLTYFVLEQLTKAIVK